MAQLDYVDPDGDGTPYPSPYPQGLNQTVYNGSKGCKECGIYMNPVQSLNSDMCPSCSRRKAVKRLNNRMV